MDVVNRSVVPNFATIQTLSCGTDLTDPLFEPFVCLKMALCLVCCGVGCAYSCGPGVVGCDMGSVLAHL